MNNHTVRASWGRSESYLHVKMGRTRSLFVVLGMLGMSCSAEIDSAEFQPSFNANLEEDLNVTPPAEDMGVRLGEAGDPIDLPPVECSHLASSDENVEICFDDLFFEFISTGWCDQAGRVEDELRGLASCSDRDLDCFYQCDGWSLPSWLQDPDDQRPFIVGNLEARVDDEEVQTDAHYLPSCASDEELASPCCVLSNEGMSIEAPLLCRHVFEEESDPNRAEETIELLQGCAGGGMMWVTLNAEGQRSLVFASLNELEHGESPNIQKVPLSSISPITALACHFGESVTALLSSGESSLSFLAINLRGNLVVDPLYDTPILDGQPWDIKQIQVDEEGLYRWTLGVGEGPEARCFEDYAFKYLRSNSLSELERCDLQRAQACLRCNSTDPLILREATLSSEGFLSLWFGSEASQMTLIHPYGLFSKLFSSAGLLGLEEIQATPPYLQIERVSLLIWNEALSQLPIQVEPTRWGFDRIKLLSLDHGLALIRLEQSLSTGEVVQRYGVYEPLSDRLTFIPELDALDHRFSAFNSMKQRDPILSGDWLVWEVEAEEKVRGFLTLQLIR